jgi:hypothetical protein
MVCYYYFLAGPLWKNYSPILPITITLLAITTLILYLLTSFTDPGILPKKAFL